jgi:nicotinamide riboside transporter PnuC
MQNLQINFKTWHVRRADLLSWIYWIIVDLVAIWLYFIKDVKSLSLLYVILLGIAVNGCLTWRRNNSHRVHTNASKCRGFIA